MFKISGPDPSPAQDDMSCEQLPDLIEDLHSTELHDNAMD